MMPLCPYDGSPLRAGHPLEGVSIEIYCTAPAVHTWDENGVLISGPRGGHMPDPPLTVTAAEIRPVALVCPHDGTRVRIDEDGTTWVPSEAACPNGHRWDQDGDPMPDALPDEPEIGSRVVSGDSVFLRVPRGWCRELRAPKDGQPGAYEMNDRATWDGLHRWPVTLLPPT